MRAHPTTRPGSRLLAAATVAILLAAGCSDDTDAVPADYFAAFDESQTELDATVSVLFESPAAERVEMFADQAPETLDAEQDAQAHEFVRGFWVGATDALSAHRDAVTEFGVPDSLRPLHDAYADALDTAIDARDSYLAEADTSSGAELLATFWELPPELEEMNTTCRAIVEEAATAGFTISNPICDE